MTLQIVKKLHLMLWKLNFNFEKNFTNERKRHVHLFRYHPLIFFNILKLKH